jgi:hypothetical protein
MSRVQRRIALLGVALPTALILFVMMGFIDGVVTVGSDFPWININLRAPQLFVAATPTGGDMGAHVLLPQLLQESLLPSGRLLGWSNAWYAGFPVLYFYFPLPALVTVLLNVVLPYGVAFKLVAAAGLVAFPISVYFFVRGLGFDRAVSGIATATASMYLFMESFSIFGGNVKSTMAGEFSFSWALAIALFYLGTVVRDTREGRGFTPTAGILLGLTAITHIVVTMVIVVVSLPLLLRKRGPFTLTTSWVVGFAVSAFWAIPMAVRVFQGMPISMNWDPVRGLVGEGASPQIVATTLPDEFVPVFVVAVIGVAWMLLRRDDISVLLTMTVIPALVYWLFGVIDFTELYNARFLPFWYVGVFVLAGITIGLAISRFSRVLSQRSHNLALFGSLGIVLLFATAAVAIHDLPGWVSWNWKGYEGKQVVDADGNVVEDRWAELSGLMATIESLPPGRVMWEHNSDISRYGTTMAPMLIPYFTDTHTSMEGLFFESSITTPFHFVNQSEMSDAPSRPMRGIRYGPFDLDRGASHLEVYDVRYYVTFTESATEAATEHPLYTEVATSPPWTIFELPPSDLVEIAERQPSVYAGELGVQEWALEWYNYDDPSDLDSWVTVDGPQDWLRIADLSERFAAERPYDVTGAEVTDVVLEEHRISFTTSAIGVPHLVKVSYFPNWTATGADGPYRAAPSLMVVVPTDEQVVLEFRQTWPEIGGLALSLVAIGLLLARLVRRRRRTAQVTAQPGNGVDRGH